MLEQDLAAAVEEIPTSIVGVEGTSKDHPTEGSQGPHLPGQLNVEMGNLQVTEGKVVGQSSNQLSESNVEKHLDVHPETPKELGNNTSTPHYKKEGCKISFRQKIN